MKFLEKILFIFFSFITYFSSTNSCTLENIATNGINTTELNDEKLKELVTINLNKALKNTLLMLFEKEYQIFIFSMSNCTNLFLSNDKIKENQFNNSLHLFSVEGSLESNSNIIKLVIQTKKEFQIFYYNNENRIETNPEKEMYYNIKTNIFPYFRNKLYIEEEYETFKNENIDIFNEEDEFFDDICFKYESLNITKSPILRKSLYYYKNDELTYPLLDSNNNCVVNKHSISYDTDSFILEYKCKRNFDISGSDISLKEISITNKEEIETYDGPNSLEDQRKLLKCSKEAFKAKNIKNNVGFYISLFLIFVICICIIFLIIQKNEIKQVEDFYFAAPPKKKTLKETLKEKNNKRNVNFSKVEVISEEEEDRKKKKKKKRKKKKQMIEEDNEEENNEDNNDLNWYNNSIEINEEKEEKDFYHTEKPKKKKKKLKKRKKKKAENDMNKTNSFENKNDQDSDFNFKNEEIDNKNKTAINFSSAYKKFQINSVNQIKEKLNLKRLVIITNLGNSLITKDKNDNNNNNEYKLKNNNLIDENNNENNLGNSFNDSKSNNNLKIKHNSKDLIYSGKDNKETEEEKQREKLGIILGKEDDTFMSNITRDYLNFEDATYFDRRENCSIFRHFMKLKNDLINIFYCQYSFVPYAARLIKFIFFFHFLFYLETLCIGQKYYFEKYYSDEFQDFLKDHNFYDNKDGNLNNYNNIKKSFLEKYLNTEEIEFTKIHFLYTFKYTFPRVLIPAAISLISYIFTAILTPRRKIMKIILDTTYKSNEKINKIQKITNNYRIVYIIFGIIGLLLMVFFFYSIVNYFFIFEEAKYDIPQSFIFSGLLRFIFDIIFWAFIVELRMCGIHIYNKGFYNLINYIYEIN